MLAGLQGFADFLMPDLLILGATGLLGIPELSILVRVDAARGKLQPHHCLVPLLCGPRQRRPSVRVFAI
jgi:hypothetical protein